MTSRSRTVVTVVAVVVGLVACGRAQVDATGTHFSPPSVSPPSAIATTTASTPTPPTPPNRAALAKAFVDLPDSWQVDPEDSGSISFQDPDGKLLCGILETAGIGEDTPTKKVIEQLAEEKAGSHPDLRREADLIAHRTRLYHFVSDKTDLWEDQFGTVNDNYLVTVDCLGSKFSSPRPWQVKQIARFMKTFRLR